MSTRPQPPIPPDSEGRYSQSEIRTLFTGTDIWMLLGRLQEAVQTLQTTTESHGERIQQVTRQADETKFASSILEKAVALHGERLRRLDKIAFVGEIVGALVAAGILVPLLTYIVTFLVHYFSAHFSN